VSEAWVEGEAVPVSLAIILSAQKYHDSFRLPCV
jgi:hypothetical protein